MKTGWKDAIFSGSRKYQMTTNTDGTVSITDATDYTQEGDVFGAAELNAIAAELNTATKNISGIKGIISITLPAAGWTGTAAPYQQRVDAASIASTHSPLISVDASQDRAERKAQEKAFAKYVDRVTTYNGYMVFECDETKPGIDLKLLVKGV